MNVVQILSRIKSTTTQLYKKISPDFIAISCVLLVHFVCMYYLQNFMFSNASEIRWASIIISTAPVVFTYHIIRFIAPPIFQYHVTIALMRAGRPIG